MKLQHLFEEAVANFVQIEDAQHDAFIQNYYEQTYQDSQKAQQVHNEVNDYFARVDSNYSEIMAYKQKGLSRNKWFEEKLTAYEQLSPGTAQAVINAIGTSHEAYVKEYGVAGHYEQVTAPFQAVGKRIAMNVFDKHISENTYMATVEAEQQFSAVTLTEENAAAKRYFDEQLDSPYDTAFKKLGTATVLRVQQSGNVKLLEQKSPTEIAAIVDRTYTTAKVGYKIATGKMKASQATDYLIDRGVARVETIIHRKAKEYGGKLGEKVGAALGSYFGPVGAAIGGTIGKVVGEKAGKYVAEKVTGGLKTVASYAKEKIGSVVNAGASLVSSGVSFFKSLF